MVKVSSPVQGYVTSKYGYRILGGARVFHAGLDIATGGKPGNVHAMFAGTVERVVTNRKPGNRVTDSYAPGRTPNYVSVRNPDGELQFYGHTYANVKVGQRVKAGQKIGVTDLSGNTTGYHCHLETWRKNNSTFDPLILFRKYGIEPGSAPQFTTGNTVREGILDMNEKQVEEIVERAVWSVLNREIAVGEATARRHGGSTAPLYALIRDGAYAYDEARDTPRRVWQYDLKVAGNTAAQIGRETISAIMALRYAAGALFDFRARFGSDDVE